MKDLFDELRSTLGHNKLRTSLTGFAVAWGVFMLIALLGAGNGLLNALLDSSGDVMTNSMAVYPGSMSIPYNGLKTGTRIRFDKRDINLLEAPAFKEIIDDVTPQVSVSDTIALGRESISVRLVGASPVLEDIEKIKIIKGRFVNLPDEEGARKVMVVGNRTASILLGGDEDTGKIIGREVTMRGLVFKVVGIFKDSEGEYDSTCYIPWAFMNVLKNGDDSLDQIKFTFHGLKTEKENVVFEDRIKKAINEAHLASPDDKSTSYIWNRLTSEMQTSKAITYIRIALWIIGLFTLMSGIVGVSNIMLISVKERTHEFGIRKALGARPWSILKLIIVESVTITAFFGYIGMLMGLIANQVMDSTIGSKAVDIGFMKMYMFKDPTVGIDVAIEATVVLIIAGTIAGLMPAVKASKVKPIEALRAE
ncbi:MAG: ABC transporter permease [Bacteroidales bacterium]|nr:ABC transporter permease [Bacteroidales bacterium]